MDVLINGEARRTVSCQDRGLLYGDGLFETLLVVDGAPRRWRQHMQRLKEGCSRLGIGGVEEAKLRADAEALCTNKARAVLKIVITRGAGGRGYRPSAQSDPTRIVQIHPYPEYSSQYWSRGVKVRVCQHRLGANPALAGIKHLNRLEQVLARSEWDEPDVAEGLMLDSGENVVEGTMTNVFVVKNKRLYTPDLTSCGVKGIVRDGVIDIAENLGVSSAETELSLDDVRQADEIFLTNSLIGIWPVMQLERCTYGPGLITQQVAEKLAPWNNGWIS